MTVHYCQKCGTALPEEAATCPKCGIDHALTGEQEAEAHYMMSGTERATAEATHDAVAERIHETGGSTLDLSGAPPAPPHMTPLTVEIRSRTAERVGWAAYWEHASVADIVERAIAAYLAEREAKRGKPYTAPPADNS